MIGLLIYVCLSAAGLTMLKIGTGKEMSFVLEQNGFTLQMNWMLLLGMLFYIASFLTSLVVMRRMNLSVFYPISAGLVYVMICALSYFVLDEKITAVQLVGMTMILAGIIIMNLHRA